MFRVVHTIPHLASVGGFVKDEVLWSKLAMHLVFPAKEFGRQNSAVVLRILPPGGRALCGHLSLSGGSSGNVTGFTSAVRLPYMVKGFHRHNLGC